MPDPSDGRPAGARSTALEWQIAWRHLRADGIPLWVKRVNWAALYLLLVGAGLWLYVTFVLAADPTVPPDQPMPAFDPVVDAGASRLEQAFGLCAAISLGFGTILLLFSLLARMFSVLATIVMFEVVLGCMAMVVVLSLMSGLEGDLRDKILSQRAHIRVSRVDGNRLDEYKQLTEAIAGTQGVAGASPFLDGEVMVRSGLNRNPAVLYGVVPARMRKVSGLPDLMTDGRFDSLDHPEDIPAYDPLSFSQMPTRVAEPSRVEEAEAEAEAETGTETGTETGSDPVFAPIELPDVDESGGTGGIDPGLPEDESEDDGGWQDPVQALGLPEDPAPAVDRGSQPPPVFAPGPVPAPGDDGDDGDDGDGGWQDPVEVLDLEPADDDEPAAEDAPDPDGLEDPDSNAEGPAPVIDPILIGSELADELAVHVGARTQLITPVGRMTPAGRIPGVLATRVGGIFHTGMYEYDSKSVYAPLPLVQKFLRTGDRVSGIEVKLTDEDDVIAGKRRIEATVAELGGEDELTVETWMDLNRNLFSAMFLEKLAMFIALSVVVFVASFGILASNLMSVLEKSSEIAVLKAMGASDRLIQRVYWAEGLCVGLVGASAGIGLGLVICWVLQSYGMPGMQSGFYIQELPVTVNPLEVVAVGGVVMLIVWAFSLYPAFVASRMRPVDALRHAD